MKTCALLATFACLWAGSGLMMGAGDATQALIGLVLSGVGFSLCLLFFWLLKRHYAQTRIYLG